MTLCACACVRERTTTTSNYYNSVRSILFQTTPRAGSPAFDQVQNCNRSPRYTSRWPTLPRPQRVTTASGWATSTRARFITGCDVTDAAGRKWSLCQWVGCYPHRRGNTIYTPHLRPADNSDLLSPFHHSALHLSLARLYAPSPKLACRFATGFTSVTLPL